MIDFERKDHYGLSDLLRIVALLRSEDGCPWDRVQTHASLRRSLLEEAYEAAEAIDREDPALLKEELGDLLLQVVFHADIERQAGDFTMDDVADGEVRKMLFRHPHVFGGQETVQDADTVLEGWEAIKRREKGQQTTAQALDAVARSLPGLWRAEKLQSKAARDGFDWPDISGALDKLDEEVSELHRAAAGDGDMTEELGDVLFAAVKVGRFAGVDRRSPSTAPVKNSSAATGRWRRGQPPWGDPWINCRWKRWRPCGSRPSDLNAMDIVLGYRRTKETFFRRNHHE